MPRALSCFFLVMVALFSTLVSAEDFTHYEQIVSELKSKLRDSAPIAEPSVDPSMEFGLGLIGSYASVGGNGVPSGDAAMKGFELHFNIDLYDTGWITEVSFSTLGSEEMSKNFAASAQEFDIKIIRKSELQDGWLLRGGMGMAARYLRTIDSRSGYTEGMNRSLDWVGVVGLDRQLNPKVSVGPEISYRLPLVQDTGDRGSLDASMRLGFHF